MQNSYIRMDLAIYDGMRGTLKLTEKSLEFIPRKGKGFTIHVSDIRNHSFIKTALTTSTLFVNEIEITVCRAHLWSADISTLSHSS
ncbi:MAG: hypothetical protein ACP5OC_08760 [Thermoplasmata archaeon]